MKRAALFACLFALAGPAFAEAPADTGGPIGSQAERDVIAGRVAGGASCARCDASLQNSSRNFASQQDRSRRRIAPSVALSCCSTDMSRRVGAFLMR